MYEHLWPADSPAIGAYWAAREALDPSVKEEVRQAAWEQLLSCRCDHGDSLIRRVITQAVVDIVEESTAELARESAVLNGAFHDDHWFEFVDRCIFCESDSDRHLPGCVGRPR